MFTLLSRIFFHDWSTFAGHKVKEKVPAHKGVEETAKEKKFRGKVTSLNVLEEYGIINQHVYFHFNVVYSGKELSLDDTVLVHAERKEPHHGFTASYVEFIHKSSSQVTNGSNLPKKPSEGSADRNFKPRTEEKLGHSGKLSIEGIMERIETIEQTVSECNGYSGRLKDGYEFYVEDGKIGFEPVIGDVIMATIQYDDLGKRVIEWEPREVRCIEGEVTANESDCGVINDEVMFFHRSCQRRVQLCVGKKVSAMIVSSEQGLFRWRAYSLCTSSNDEDVNEIRKPFVNNQDGVYITDPLDFRSISLGKDNDLKVILRNDTDSGLVFLGCSFQNKNCVFHVGKNLCDVNIPEKGSIDLTIHCKTEALGQHEDFLLFEFQDFIIRRNVTVTVTDPMQHILKPIAPFSGANRNRQTTQLDCENLVIIPGQKPYKPTLQFSNKLPPANIPRPLMRAVMNREDLSTVVPSLYQPLNMRNYVHKFSTLLYLEEIQVRIDMKKFDISEALLRRKGDYLSLEVLGLAEGRPSLIIGDKAILVPPYQKSSFAYEGCIHEVHLNEVLLKFNDSFQSSYDGESFDVRFQLNRTNFRRLHQCVHQVAENHEYAIFPSMLTLKDPLFDLGLHRSYKNGSSKRHCNKSVQTLRWQNEQLNWKQKEAVMRILECRCRPLPYIIFGPPGTGKTITLVEAVLQVQETIPDSRIIVCTPSNSAADLVAQRIIESGCTTGMLRLNSFQRSLEAVPECVRPFCQDKDSLDNVLQYKIIISTCSTAGSLYSVGLCNDFFTHVFIDEAGQLMEPESDIAVGFIDSQTRGQVIMAGDPQQLGPVLRSSHALSYGLQVSYLERLMNTALYARNEEEYGEYGGYNPLLVTMLEESYRSHPDILRFPSDTFYFSRIVCRFPTDSACELSSWDQLPTPGFPVVFHGVKGEEFREHNSPSWFNPSEVVQVAKYLQKLYGFGLVPDDVGIIAPYKKQVEKIRLLLSALSLDPCKIGSVEEFQGQERRAIIISTVRSSDRFVSCDLLYNLGFISNPKRLNVAVTRSRELLVVVGNPYVLSRDLFWHSFVRYCVVNGCYTGCELPLSFVQSNKPTNP